jgi:hypothetical protein
LHLNSKKQPLYGLDYKGKILAAVALEKVCGANLMPAARRSPPPTKCRDTTKKNNKKKQLWSAFLCEAEDERTVISNYTSPFQRVSAGRVVEKHEKEAALFDAHRSVNSVCARRPHCHP